MLNMLVATFCKFEGDMKYKKIKTQEKMKCGKGTFEKNFKFWKDRFVKNNKMDT